jgi:SAM-dependent methyltransferase
MWDERYQTPDYVYGTEPNHFVVSAKGRLPQGGKVLCVADGEGRNGVFLARQGFGVLSVDISPAALAKARKLAETHGVDIDTQQADLLAWDWPVASFDAVVGIFIQPFGLRDRQIVFDGIVRALKPGGILLLEGYRTDQLQYGTGGPGVLEKPYSESQLPAELGALNIESIRSYEHEMQEGAGHNGLSALIDLVAVKRKSLNGPRF